MFLNSPGSKELPTVKGNSWLNVLERKLSGANHPRALPTLLSRNPLNEGFLYSRLPLTNGEQCR